MNAREVTGFEATIFWFTFLLFTLPYIPYRKLLISYINKRRNKK